MKVAYLPVVGRQARRLAGIGMPPLYGKLPLVRFHEQGYVSPSTRLAHPELELGKQIYIGDGTLFYRDDRGGSITIAQKVHLHENCTLQTGEGGHIFLGADTHIQPRCQFSAYCGEIRIGQRVEIAPSCAFYPYNHEMARGRSIREQALFSRSGVHVGDDAWLGFGVTLLDGANVGEGAVVAANSVVRSVIPAYAIAAGSPAEVIGERV